MAPPARWRGMLTIDYGFGMLGALAIALMIGAGAIVAIFLFAASKRAHDEIVAEEHDRGNDDVPIA